MHITIGPHMCTHLQCTMRRLFTRNSSGLLAPGDIFKNHQKYLIDRYFFLKLTTRWKIEKIKFL